MAFLNEMLSGFGYIVTAPFKSLDALWVIIPLFIMWFVLEIYFAKFKKEELGWNTALANGITLGWLTLEGIKSLFSMYPADFWLRFIANAVILSYAIMIIYFSFTHKISSKWDFMMASPTPVYFLGVFSVSWGYGTLEVTRYVLLDLLILFVFVVIFFKIFRHFIKPSKKEEEEGKEEEGKEEMPKMPELGKDEEMPSLEGLGDLGGKEGDDFGKMPPLGKI